jgi:hypothetical protein
MNLLTPKQKVLTVKWCIIRFTNELIFDSTYTESKSKKRNIYLGGIGFTWRISKDAEIYGQHRTKLSRN